MSKLTIDNCASCLYLAFRSVDMTLVLVSAAGDAANSKSDGKPAGHNTDGFDCSTTDLTIEDRCVLWGYLSTLIYES